MRTPKVGTVIIDQLRKIKFEPYRLWQPPLTQPVAIDDLVNRFLGRPWHKEYGSACNLVFPIGIIDRPYKHDQPPWTVDTSGPGANVLILGAGGSGKTTALQTLICSAALTHTPQQVQFYCLAYSSTALTTVSRIPHVGEVAGPTDPYGVRRTVAELLALVRERKRSFLECGIASMEMFRRRKFGGEAGPVPDDGFGDVYLVIDNYRALAEENEVLIEQVNVIINQGPSFGVHVVVTADRESELRPPVRSGFGSVSSCAWRRLRTPSWCVLDSPRTFRSSRGAAWLRSTTSAWTATRRPACTPWWLDRRWAAHPTMSSSATAWSRR